MGYHKEARMTGIAVTRGRLEAARSLPVLLDAAYAAFEEIMSAIRDHQDRAGGWFTELAFAAAAAGDGRDAIAGAPSLPRPAHADCPAGSETPDLSGTAGDLATALTDLAGLLATRLAQAAESAAVADDRMACHVAAWQAREISGLLSGRQS
jgi:hypothetical protein